MMIIWPYATAIDPFEHQRTLQPGETRRRLARAKHEEETTMYTHLHLYEPTIKAKNARLFEEAMLAEHIRIARGDQSGRIATIATGIRRTIGTLLIATGERLQPAPARPLCEERPDTVMQA